MRVLAAVVWLAAAVAVPAADRTLDFYFVDVEGGQATLIVTPAGESMLVDAGWPGFDGRDAGRIVEAARLAGLKAIDYLLVTHYHLDHVGGVPPLVARFPVRQVIDHGGNTETGKNADALSTAYEEAIRGLKRLTVKPGDPIPLQGVEVKVVVARGEQISKPLPGAGQPNPLCAAEQRKPDDPSENARSIGFLLTYGKFRLVDLADLTWNKELELVCPTNRVGTSDVYLVTHHGSDLSGPTAIVHALRPRVAVMNNGAKKGGSPSAWRVIRNCPTLEDLWQLHFALAGGKESNSPDDFIANLEPKCQGKWLKLSASRDGSFTMLNSRNGFRKQYRPKGK